MSKLVAVVSTKRENVHTCTYVAVVEAPIEDSDKIKENYDILTIFNTNNANDINDEANKFMEEHMFKSCKEYTQYLNDNGMHIPDSHINNRWVITYVPDDVATNPGYFLIYLSDYHTLKGLYPSIRMVSNEETDNLDSTIVHKGIKINSEVADRLDEVKFYQTEFFMEGTTDVQIENEREMEGKLSALVANLFALSNTSDSFARLAMIKAKLPNATDTEAKSIDESLMPLFTKIQELMKQGMSNNDIIKYLETLQ